MLAREGLNDVESKGYGQRSLGEKEGKRKKGKFVELERKRERGGDNVVEKR